MKRFIVNAFVNLTSLAPGEVRQVPAEAQYYNAASDPTTERIMVVDYIVSTDEVETPEGCVYECHWDGVGEPLLVTPLPEGYVMRHEFAGWPNA